VLLGQDHRGIEADDREPSGDVQDRPDDLFADDRIEEVELGGVVPGKARTVVPVVDITHVAGPALEPLEDHRGVAVVPVVILEDDPDSLVARQVGAVERVGGIGRLGEREEPLRVLEYPARIDPHVVRHHVAREPDATGGGAVAELRIGGLAAEVAGDPVVVERVGRCHRLRIAPHPLDPLGGP
jgi:hypothetical protein